jgi:hypothetical protein
MSPFFANLTQAFREVTQVQLDFVSMRAMREAERSVRNDLDEYLGRVSSLTQHPSKISAQDLVVTLDEFGFVQNRAKQSGLRNAIQRGVNEFHVRHGESFQGYG